MFYIGGNGIIVDDWSDVDDRADERLLERKKNIRVSGASVVLRRSDCKVIQVYGAPCFVGSTTAFALESRRIITLYNELK